MIYRQDAAYSPTSTKIGRPQLVAKTIFDGTKLPLVPQRPQHHYRWVFGQKPALRWRVSTAIAVVWMLVWLAIPAAALAASPSPNVLPAESRGVTQAPPPQPINWDRV